jgi:hypothetical protein
MGVIAAKATRFVRYPCPVLDSGGILSPNARRVSTIEKEATCYAEKALRLPAA